MADKSFEELKEELKSKLESGYILDDEKMADLEQALKDNGNDISKIDISKYSKKEQEAPESSNDQKNQGTVISDHDNSGDENTHEPSEPVDENWKEDYKREWRQWAEENNKEFEDVNIPGSGNDVQIRLYDSKEQKKKGEYAAQISYKSPHNVSLSGANGKVPDSKYFEQTVALAMKKNGPEIEFGDIKSDEFSAKLLAACYINGANPTGNVPTEEQIAQWPKELQDMVNAAKEKAEKGAEKTSEAENKNEPEKAADYRQAWSDVLDHKIDKPGEELDLAAYKTLEDKATYLAAAQIAGIKVKNAPTAEDLNGITDPKIQTVLNDAKELNAVREKINEQKEKSSDEPMDVTMFNKKMQTYYNIAALEAGVKLSTTLEESDLRSQPHHLESALRRQRNEAKAAEIRAKKAQEKGVDEKTFEQSRNRERQIRIDAYKAKQNLGR